MFNSSLVHPQAPTCEPTNRGFRIKKNNVFVMLIKPKKPEVFYNITPG